MSLFVKFDQNSCSQWRSSIIMKSLVEKNFQQQLCNLFSRKAKKKGTTARKYDKLLTIDWIPNITFVENHHLNKFSHPADCYHTFIP